MRVNGSWLSLSACHIFHVEEGIDVINWEDTAVFGCSPEKANVSYSVMVGPFPAEVYRYLDWRQREQAGVPGIM